MALMAEVLPMTQALLSFPAPAKLNLGLKVTGRRSDGYHLLETVFHFLDYGDTVQIRIRDDGLVERSSELAGVPAEQDLVVRAARLLQSFTGTGLGATIHVEKRIPMGGGLGGGSSDAATVLMALNHLWGTGVDRDTLMGLGVRLGADVPVFIFGNSAFATGIGELLTPIDVPPMWYCVFHPGVNVPTAEIFSSKLLTRDSAPSIMPILETTQRRRNDLQSVVCDRYPAVSELLNELKEYGLPLMTGSGSCCFIEVESRSEADKVYRSMSGRYSGFVAKGMNCHPLKDIV
ncbi:4-(cytidine 5'-diphospho)-2-C-methyl-D-erythritol kinase [Paludibacterium paludis]|uniref:4-diphosphocytidyl-2-C-methyl-D-erythritol kinase n=1 Tax=Paludibacterium paludis TaxID=1225769 RepID=A0A918NZ45_9NEIS|nr:4-(cytidine 5'-diphospho)-2-C-methyl-D-erythritol kinase [Paludibacterium paludis]GGY08496.1 4-diphosphocytidyl-2-C-methyl-D-erythritol kinase [Paludibacterium paludis]